MKGSGDVYPAVDLTNCDREPIHIIGTSQSHAAGQINTLPNAVRTH